MKISEAIKKRHYFEESSFKSAKSVYVGNNTCLCVIAENIKIYVASDDLSLSPHLMINGYWESWISVLFKNVFNLIQPERVINVGANVGYYSLLSSSFNRETEVIAYEPQKKLADLIRRSAMVNGFSNCSVFELAVGKSNGVAWLKQYADLYGSATISNTTEIGESALSVEVISLDSVSDLPIDLMILDAEGFEYEIIFGAINRITISDKIVIFIEFSASRYKNLDEFVCLLEELNLNPFLIDYSSGLVAKTYADLRNERGVIDLVLSKNIDLSTLVIDSD
jgi:FkbM family methyltransferase